MKNCLIYILALLIACSCGAGAVQAGGDRTFSNPLCVRSWPDPTIWRDGGTYYSVATGIGLMKKSTDMVEWEPCMTAVVSPEDYMQMKGYGNNFWAPDITRVGGKLMMYVTMYNSAEDSSIGVLSSNNDGAAFSFLGRLTWSKDTGIKDTIDPEVVTDPRTGRVWMFFGSTGKVHRVELDRTGTRLADGRYVHVAGVDIDDNQARDKVFEGAYLHWHDGWWYLFASAGQYWNHTYRIVVGRSPSLEGEFVDREGRRMTEGYGTAVMSSRKGDRFFGPGHNGEIFTDSTGQDYIYYHCHDGNVSSKDRQMYMQRLFWDKEGWPYVKGGTPLEEEVAPVL